MEIEEFLEEALRERFKADSIVKALEKKIKNRIENNVFNKYKEQIVYANNLEYKLYKVKAELYHFEKSINLNNTSISMAYFCVSKLPKIKRDRIEKCKLYFDKYGRTEWNNFKTPIWYNLHYNLSTKEALKGDFYLRIEL